MNTRNWNGMTIHITLLDDNTRIELQKF